MYIFRVHLTYMMCLAVFGCCGNVGAHAQRSLPASPFIRKAPILFIVCNLFAASFFVVVVFLWLSFDWCSGCCCCARLCVGFLFSSTLVCNHINWYMLGVDFYPLLYRRWRCSNILAENRNKNVSYVHYYYCYSKHYALGCCCLVLMGNHSIMQTFYVASESSRASFIVFKVASGSTYYAIFFCFSCLTFLSRLAAVVVGGSRFFATKWRVELWFYCFIKWFNMTLSFIAQNIYPISSFLMTDIPVPDKHLLWFAIQKLQFYCQKKKTNVDSSAIR